MARAGLGGRRPAKADFQMGLADYHLLPAVRGDLLHKLGRGAEAGAKFTRAVELARAALCKASVPAAEHESQPWRHGGMSKPRRER